LSECGRAWPCEADKCRSITTLSILRDVAEDAPRASSNEQQVGKCHELDRMVGNCGERPVQRRHSSHPADGRATQALHSIGAHANVEVHTSSACRSGRFN
jgi:hypothetical protein